LWVESGEPVRWVAYRRGEWGEAELAGLLESLRYTRYWPLDPADVRRVLAEATEHYRAETARAEPSLSAVAYWRGYGKLVAHCPVCAAEVPVPATGGGRVRVRCRSCGIEFVAVDSLLPVPSPPEVDPLPPPMPEPAWETKYTDDVRYGADGSCHAVCPHCEAHDVTVPATSSDALTLFCPRCLMPFVVRPVRTPIPADTETALDAFKESRFLRCCFLPCAVVIVIGFVRAFIENYFTR
jgi:hypothetical protein